ncbi:hypothetical protein SK3146_01491 [Paenibacillus konkukensis]|uniref:Uncharacterized protein n=1 Tax=Paenibacillus konkukensis TaxID=2020716 RepID=A0ABY4RLM0_9BACL|nr:MULTISPECIES: hypothetical protein [Paenibacillus]UQZ82334.1 hypothetical protein SK3146_01491 [Paenibacillus konkukensis]
MQIKKKSDIETLLNHFSSFAQWDVAGKKHYFVFSDRKRGGQWTLMGYPNDRFSVHGRGEDYLDEQESFFEERESIISFLWEHRSAFNSAVKQTQLQAVR